MRAGDVGLSLPLEEQRRGVLRERRFGRFVAEFQPTGSLAVSAFTSADCFRDHDAYGINRDKQKDRADEYTGREEVLIDALGAKQKVNRVNQP